MYDTLDLTSRPGRISHLVLCLQIALGAVLVLARMGVVGGRSRGRGVKKKEKKNSPLVGRGWGRLGVLGTAMVRRRNWTCGRCHDNTMTGTPGGGFRLDI